MVVTADPSVLRGIPEFFETNLGECLQARTESLVTFRELGPPDICHIIKSNPKASTKDIGSYHFVLGVDASSSATFSAYLNSLTYMLGTIGGKSNPWKITGGTFCCFNAFSRVDIRVEVKIPGGVDAYIVDLKGERHSIGNPAGIWQETHVSAILRSILDNQNQYGVEPLMGLRKLDPIPTIKAEKRFLEAASNEFFKGWQLGSSPEIQVPTITSNHLTIGILKYFADAGRHLDAANFFVPLFAEDTEVGAVLAYCYIQADEELKAVKVMYDASKKYPIPYDLLLVQVDFLLSKKKYDKALMLAKLAVTRAPSEYNVWAKLTEVFLELEDYESALLALNSCPMFTFIEKDSHRLPAPARTHLPLKLDNLNPNYDPKTAPNNHGYLSGDNDSKEYEIHPEMRRLPSLSLRGTFKKAYDILTRISLKVGWDELLKYRSKVFVMEDEYRIHRAMAEEESQKGLALEEEEGDVPLSQLENISLDDPQKSLETPKKKGKLSVDELVKKVSQNPNLTNAFEQPSKGTKAANPRIPFTGVNFTFKHKRLCEKWLDNLFMVLYNDLRIYTAMKQEMKLFKQEQQDVSASDSNVASNGSIAISHRKSGVEWEIYGRIALHLHHQEEAIEAYKQSIEQMFSNTALVTLIRLYAQQGEILPCLQLVNRMVACLDRVFAEETYPSPIASSLFLLIRKNGLTKVQNALVAMNINPITFRNIT